MCAGSLVGNALALSEPVTAIGVGGCLVTVAIS